ncbi:ribosome hibernation-promoting factor, HPF/YfiA family [Peptostreptococcus faecalis]|uniref:ribosome hibernation-promoting factor, HPF/YfiA family n=1 Tax=Peptostreptococcus faecalis TaxID=2045015 RepID=UPI000C7A4D86|nr:ribosome-associated translation inhibitor RaiA [Peptostreptococcus faecalis]
MKIIISGKKIKLTDGIKGYIDKKFGRLEKFLGPEAELRVTVSANKKEKQKVEATLDNINGHVVRAEEAQDDLYAAIDLVCDKLNRQIVKYKNKFRTRASGNDTIRLENFEELVGDEDFEILEEEDTEFTFERKKKFDLRPMSPEEAVLQMNLLGHDFFLFKDQDTFEVSLVYRRGDGGYGLIEQE